MRRFYLYFLTVLAAGAIGLASCEKEAPATQITTTPLPPVINTAPKAYAGQDIWILVPTNSCTLSGSAIDAETNVEKYLWKQVSGPLSCIIESTNSVQTKVSNLEKGTYEFELNVTDKGGLNNKDTVTVFVREPAAPGQGEVIFKDLKWSCPMGCSLLINCFSCFVPVNQKFKVYLRGDNSNQWVEAVPENQWTANDKYIYGISNNNLWIYTNESNETPDVKITY
jgi:hypothetical protein